MKLNNEMFDPIKLQTKIDCAINAKNRNRSVMEMRDEKAKPVAGSMLSIGFAPKIGAGSNFKYLTQISPKY